MKTIPRIYTELSKKLSMNREEIDRAAITLAMTEVARRLEPWNFALETASHLKSRRPSEVSEHIKIALVHGYSLWQALMEVSSNTIDALITAGIAKDDAVEMVVSGIQEEKWKYIHFLVKENN